MSKVRVWRLLYLSMKALAVSCITNMATGIQAVKHSHARVLEIANQAGGGGGTPFPWVGGWVPKKKKKKNA